MFNWSPARSVVVGSVAVVAFGGCGFLGDDIDCTAINDEMAVVSESLGNDGAKFRQGLDDFRESAEKVDDSDLRQAMSDYADTAEEFHEYVMAPDPMPPGDVFDPVELVDLAARVQETCSTV